VKLDGEETVDVDVNQLAAPRGHGIPAAEPVSKVDFRQRGLRHSRQWAEGRRLAEGQGGHSLRRAALWDEVKDKLHESAYSLSGGQQQRLCIARALAVDPEVAAARTSPARRSIPSPPAKIED